MAATMDVLSFDFEFGRQLFCESLRGCVNDKSLQGLKDAFSAAGGSEADKKTSVDQAFRDEILNLVCRDEGPQTYMDLLHSAADAVQDDICSTATLFIMMSDVFDTISLEQCEQVFTFVEDRVGLWKLELFYNAGKNYLLRMCNDLLRRLSKSQNTVFCGRIQLFLARLFPLEEKSGLNLMSQFNIENVTLYSTKSEESDKDAVKARAEDPSMEIEDGEMDDLGSSNIPVDYNLYRKFWSLQDFFRRPGQCYEKFAWKTFTNYSDEVLNCFASYKLDDVNSQRKMREQQAQSSSQLYFAKYLTSEKLLDLQLSDSSFRRYVLVQYLILFQYLNAQVRFKTATQTLTDEQSTWIKDANERVLERLRETPPDGEQFTATVKHILAREDNWNSWKNDGCQSYIRKNDEARAKITARAKKRSFGEDLLASGGAKMIKMGNTELTRLWNLCPDNMAACKSEQRDYLPTLDEYFETAIEQADPDGGIEETYRVINNSTYGWKGLRLLSRNSPYFFGPVASGSTTTYKTVPQYLELMVSRMIKEIPTTPANDSRTADGDDTSVTNGNTDENIENNTRDEDDTTGGGGGDEDQASVDDDAADVATADEEEPAGNTVSIAVLQSVADRLGDNWKLLAAKLGFQDDDVSYFESENAAMADRAFKMLSVWSDNEGQKASVDVLRQALGDVELSSLAVEVLGVKDES